MNKRKHLQNPAWAMMATANNFAVYVDQACNDGLAEKHVRKAKREAVAFIRNLDKYIESRYGIKPLSQ